MNDRLRAVRHGLLFLAPWFGIPANALAQQDPQAPVEPKKGILPVPDYSPADGARRHLTGSWSDLRQSWAEAGFTIDAYLTQSVQGIADGGRERTTKYGGKFETISNLDLDRMNVLRGGLLTMHTESRYGESVNQESGALLAVNATQYFPLADDPDDDIPIAITELRYTQFLSPQFGVFLGKFIPLGGDVNEFAGGRGDTQFSGLPFLSASVTALTNPYSGLGGGALWMPTPTSVFASTIYQSTDSSTTTGFDNFGEGWTWVSNARTQYAIGKLPGGAMASVLYSFDNDFVDFGARFVDTTGGLAIPRTDESWSVFVNGWQYLFVSDDKDGPIDLANAIADRRGYGLFFRAAIADPDTNPVRWIVSGGIGGKGTIPGREADTFGIGYAYSETETDQFVVATLLDSHANRFEAYYDFALAPSTDLTFDVQLVDPLPSQLDPALLFAARLRVRF